MINCTRRYTYSVNEAVQATYQRQQQSKVKSTQCSVITVENVSLIQISIQLSKY